MPYAGCGIYTSISLIVDEEIKIAITSTIIKILLFLLSVVVILANTLTKLIGSTFKVQRLQLRMFHFKDHFRRLTFAS
jgi:preprotein translocase subunit Sec61beta